MFDSDFDLGDFEWEGEEINEPPTSFTVCMIEVFDGNPTFSKDGVYLNSADMITWIERDITEYRNADMEDEANTMEYFLNRFRLLVANRGPRNG